MNKIKYNRALLIRPNFRVTNPGVSPPIIKTSEQNKTSKQIIE